MDSLYLKHFSLSREPFNVTPDPSFLYLSVTHKEALAQLNYGINARKGFIVLTGEVGTGKTTLIHALMRELDSKVKTALIFNTIINPRDFLRSTCQEFGLITDQGEPQEIHDYLRLLNQFLLESYRRGDNVALIIDEAQNLSAAVLESIRLLSNFETPQDKLLQILLAGQPELAARLNSPELRQLKQRVVLWHQLRSLNFRDCKEYVDQRLKLAGGSPSLFTPEAIETVYLYSHGTPRLINILCDNGMLTAYALHSEGVGPEMIREVAEDLHLIGPLREAVSTRTDLPKKDLNGKHNGNQERSGLASVDVTQKETDKLPIKRDAMTTPTIGEPIAKDNGRMRSAFFPQSNLIDPAPPGFLEDMVSELIEAMGPLAAFVLREHVAHLGESMETFPKARLTELVESASQEILNETLKRNFQSEMREQLRTLSSPKDRA